MCPGIQQKKAYFSINRLSIKIDLHYVIFLLF